MHLRALLLIRVCLVLSMLTFGVTLNIISLETIHTAVTGAIILITGV